MIFLSTDPYDSLISNRNPESYFKLFFQVRVRDQLLDVPKVANSNYSLNLHMKEKNNQKKIIFINPPCIFIRIDLVVLCDED